MSTANTDISLGEQLRASFESTQSDLDEKCAEIIEQNCRERALKGYGFCELEWENHFWRINVDKDRITQLVTQMGIDIETCDDIGITLRWIKEKDIEKIKKKAVKRKPKTPKLETIPEEKTTETMQMDTTQTTS